MIEKGKEMIGMRQNAEAPECPYRQLREEMAMYMGLSNARRPTSVVPCRDEEKGVRLERCVV